MGNNEKLLHKDFKSLDSSSEFQIPNSLFQIPNTVMHKDFKSLDSSSEFQITNSLISSPAWGTDYSRFVRVGFFFVHKVRWEKFLYPFAPTINTRVNYEKKRYYIW